MDKEKLKWLIILFIAVSSLIGYGLYNRNVVFGEKIEIEKLEQRVNNYISRINTNLEISDIFIYSDSDYYFSIEESDTGMGAMELLINPYTGSIRPEQGPNMMWNEKYGMHGSGFFNNNLNNSKITSSEALGKANDYIQNKINSNYIVTDEGHEFYGYFTFHFESNENTVEMLSVHAYTGDVWYHNWHGTLINIRSNHDDK